MATIAATAEGHSDAAPGRRQRLKDFGRSVTYQIAGLPIAVRALFTRSRTDPESAIRRAYAKRYWRPRSLAEATHLALAMVIWPFALIGLEVAFILRNGGPVARRFGRPIHRQLLDQLRLYLTAGVLPPWYYIFELHRDPDADFARDFIYRWESKGGVMRLLKEGEREPSSQLSDKALFAEYCKRHHLATAPVFAVFRNGRTELRASASEIATGLVVKPVFGRGGRGVERWDHYDHFYRSPQGHWFTKDELFHRLQERSRSIPLLIQPRLVNHPALTALNNDALSTVRLVSCLNETGEPELIGAAIRMAIGGNHTVDNLHAGGIAAAVDLDTGRLSRASNLGADSRLGWTDEHPDTGARITGTRMPMWTEVREFALRCHRAFADRVIVGWDIAITPEGPVLVEGNGAPDLDIMQRFIRHGLMAARLGALLAFHLTDAGIPGAA